MGETIWQAMTSATVNTNASVNASPPLWLMVAVGAFSLTVFVTAAVALTAWRARSGLLTQREMVLGLLGLGLVMALGLAGYIAVSETKGTSPGFPSVGWAIATQILGFLIVMLAVVATKHRTTHDN